MKLTFFEFLKRSKNCEDIGEFGLFSAKNMLRFVEICSVTTAHSIYVDNKQIVTWVASAYDFYYLCLEVVVLICGRIRV